MLHQIGKKMRKKRDVWKSPKGDWLSQMFNILATIFCLILLKVIRFIPRNINEYESRKIGWQSFLILRVTGVWVNKLFSDIFRQMKKYFKLVDGNVSIVPQFCSHVGGKSFLNEFVIFCFEYSRKPLESNKTSTEIEMGYESVFACNSAFV